MAWFIRYWRITPKEYYELTVEQHRAMVDLMKEEARENRRRAAKGRR